MKSLKVPLAGKTGTTNDNYDAWFIGFSSNLVIGVYIGYDNPKTLGKYETGSKAALPVFKDFVENVLYKEDFNDFEIPEIEALKFRDINSISNNNLISINDSDKMIKFRQFY